MHWLLTAAFGTATIWFTGRHRLAGDRADRVSNAAHILMGSVMTAMVWAPTGPVGTWLPTTVFAATAIWFLGRAELAPAQRRLSNVHHAVMAAGMTWMAGTMSAPLVLAGYFLSAVPVWGTVALARGGAGRERIDALGHAAFSVGVGGLLLTMRGGGAGW